MSATVRATEPRRGKRLPSSAWANVKPMPNPINVPALNRLPRGFLR